MRLRRPILTPAILTSTLLAASGCSSAEPDPTPPPATAQGHTLTVSAGVSFQVKLDWLTATPAEPALQKPDYLVVPPTTKQLTAYFDTPVGLGPALEIAQKAPRLVVATDSGQSFEVAGEAGLTTLRFDLEDVSLPSGTTASMTIFAGDDVIGETGKAVLFPTAGDADGDGDFDSMDLVLVSQAGKYETGAPAGFSEGDFDADGVFSSSDFVTALQSGAYEQGPLFALPSAPALMKLDSTPYYAEDDEPASGADPCTIKCALVGTEHAPDRRWQVEHEVAPGCWHDDDCAWGPQFNGAGDPAWESCQAPANASALASSLSGWRDGTHYQFTSCGYPEDYATSLPGSADSASTSSSLCQQRVNVKLMCDYSKCENSQRSCSFAVKSKVEGSMWAEWSRSRYNLTKNVVLENESMQPAIAGKLRAAVPGRAEFVEATLDYSPAKVSTTGMFIIPDSGTATGPQPTDKQCKDFAKAYLDGSVYLDCYLKWGSATVPGWECKLGAKASLGAKVDLDKLFSCLFKSGEGPTGDKIEIRLHGDEFDETVGQTLDLSASKHQQDIGALFVHADLGTHANSKITIVWDDFYNKWVNIGEASSLEAGVHLSASTWVESSGDDPHCTLDAAPFRNKQELSTKILSADEINLTCSDRDALQAWK